MPLPPRQLSLFPRLPPPRAEAGAAPVRSRVEDSSSRVASAPPAPAAVEPPPQPAAQVAARPEPPLPEEPDLGPEPTTSRGELRNRAAQLAWRLSAELAMPVRLAVTDNRSTMVSFRRSTHGLVLRLHHMFLDAPEPVVRAVADYAGRGRRGAGNVLDEYIRRHQPRIRKERHSAEAELEPLGRCFNLQAIFDSLNRSYFQGSIQARIGWGRMPPRRRRKSIRLGVYDHQTREIRIHPALDRPEVPAFFVEFIVFHEMLHQLFPSASHSGRRVHHPRAFRDRERAFPLYAAALRWERENLGLLLRG